MPILQLIIIEHNLEEVALIQTDTLMEYPDLTCSEHSEDQNNNP